jgi:hypothetical protein
MGAARGRLVAAALVLATAGVLYPGAVVPLRGGGGDGSGGGSRPDVQVPRSGIDRRSMWGEMRK